MKIIISESQHRKLILEGLSNEIKTKITHAKNFTKKVLKETEKQIGLDLSFLMTWGATLGGLVSPVSKFIEGKYPDMSSTDLALLSTGIILTYFSSNKIGLSKVLTKIKELNLIQEFDHMAEMTKKLKDTFLNFIDSLAVPVGRLTNMLAYSFLIPLLPDIYELAQGSTGVEVSEIVKRIVGFIGVSVLGVSVKNLIISIVRRFRNQR